jgi:hypothetical protein
MNWPWHCSSSRSACPAAPRFGLALTVHCTYFRWIHCTVRRCGAIIDGGDGAIIACVTAVMAHGT